VTLPLLVPPGTEVDELELVELDDDEEIDVELLLLE